MKTKGQTTIELLIILAASLVALVIIYSLYAEQVNIGTFQREEFSARSSIQKIINASNSLVIAGAGSQKSVELDFSDNVLFEETIISGNTILIKLSNGTEIFGTADVQFSGNFRGKSGKQIINLYYDGSKVFIYYNDFEINQSSIVFSTIAPSQNSQRIILRNLTNTVLDFNIINNFPHSEINLDISPEPNLEFSVGAGELKEIDIDFEILDIAFGNYSGNLQIISEIEGEIVTRNINISIEAIREFKPLQVTPISSYFQTTPDNNVVKQFVVCNRTLNDITNISVETNVNPDSNLLEFFEAPIIEEVLSESCVEFDIEFKIPIHAETKFYDANLIFNYNDSFSRTYLSAEIFPKINLLKSVEDDSLSANYFSSYFIKQNSLGSFIPTGELDWNKYARNDYINSKVRGELSPDNNIGGLFDSSLVGLWHLNGDAIDSSGNSIDGVNNGAVVTSGLWGSDALEFDGDSSFVDFGNVLNLGLDDFSFNFWIKKYSLGSSGAIVSKSRAAGQTNRFWINVQSDGRIRIGASWGSSGHTDYIGTKSITPNKWYQVSVVGERDDLLKIYINGILDSEFDISAHQNVNVISNNPFRIGSYTASDNLGTSMHFYGKIEEASMWNRALSEEEINELYFAQKGDWVDENLIIYYKFNEVDGDVIFNSMREHNATLVDGASINAKGMWDSNALSLDGEVGYVNIPSISFGEGEDFTAMYWFKTNRNDGYGILNHATSFSSGRIGHYFDRIRFWGPTVDIYLDELFYPDVWNHFTAVRSEGVVYIYKNGVLVGSGNYSSAQTFQKIGGKSEDSSWDLYDGLVDEVKIYDRALTHEEIIADYNSFLENKFSDNNIIDAGFSASWDSIKINSDLNYSFGFEICGVADDDCSFDKWNDSLVGLWHLNADANDSSGNDNDGVWSGTESYAQGLWGTSAGEFDGSNQIIVDNDDSIGQNGLDELTVSFWIYPTRTISREGVLSTMLVTNWNTNGFNFYLRDETYEQFAWNIGSNFIRAGNRILNSWQHIVGTYDGEFMRLYFNGIEIGSTPRSGKTPNNENDLIIGNGYNNFFDGKLEEVAILDRALSEQEVWELYLKGSSRLDLDVFSCEDSFCESKLSNIFIENAKNNYLYDISSLDNSRYLGFDVFFRRGKGLENVSSVIPSSFLRDVNISSS